MNCLKKNAKLFLLVAIMLGGSRVYSSGSLSARCLDSLRSYLNVLKYSDSKVPGLFFYGDSEYLKSRITRKKFVYLPWTRAQGLDLQKSGSEFVESLVKEKKFRDFLSKSPLVLELLGRAVSHKRIVKSHFNNFLLEEGGVFHRGPFLSEVVSELRNLLDEFEYNHGRNGFFKWYNGLSDKELLAQLEDELLRVLERLNSDWFFKRAGIYESLATIYKLFDDPKNTLDLGLLMGKSSEKFRLVAEKVEGGYFTFESLRDSNKRWIVSVADLHEFLPDELRRKHQVGFDFIQLPESYFYKVEGEPFEYLTTRTQKAKESFEIRTLSDNPVKHAENTDAVPASIRGAFLFVNGVHPDGFYFLDKWIEYLPDLAKKMGVGFVNPYSKFRHFAESRWFMPTTSELMKKFSSSSELKDLPIKFYVESRLGGATPEKFVQMLATEQKWPLSENGVGFFHDRMVHMFAVVHLPNEVAQNILNRAKNLYSKYREAVSSGFDSRLKESQELNREFVEFLDSQMVEMSLKYFAYRENPNEVTQEQYLFELHKLSFY